MSDTLFDDLEGWRKAPSNTMSARPPLLTPELEAQLLVNGVTEVTLCEHAQPGFDASDQHALYCAWCGKPLTEHTVIQLKAA